MSPLRDKAPDWQQHLARYQRLSIPFAEDETPGRLCAAAMEMEHRIEKFEQAGVEAEAEAEERMLDAANLLAEIDTFLARTRGAMFFASHLMRPPRFSADDLREAARLCRAEAQASEAVATRRALASRALDLAMILGEESRPGKYGGT